MANHELDITKEFCPMTFVKTKLKLSQIDSGDILEVTLNEGEPLENIPGSVSEEGHEVLKVTHLEGVKHKVFIKKK